MDKEFPSLYYHDSWDLIIEIMAYTVESLI